MVRARPDPGRATARRTSRRRSKPASPLCDFLRTYRDQIIDEWTQRVKVLAPARKLSRAAIVDHLPTILDRVADIVEASHSGRATAIGDLPEGHAVDRLARGFDLDQIVTEYSLLRRTILDLWEQRVGMSLNVAELRNLDAALDDSIAQSVIRYARVREKLFRALDRVSEAALGSADLDAFLRDLLLAALEGTASVDTCAVFLLEDDVLRLRAAVGFEEELPPGYSLAIGEGFSGHVSKVGQPVFLPEAWSNPLVISPVLRRRNVRAIYGVPMISEGKAIGVAQIGSVTASDFSDEDKLLFRTVVSRATSGVVKAQILADLRRTEAAQRFLSDATRQLAESFDYEQTLAKVAHLAVPVIADWCLVDLLEDGKVRRVSVAHSDPEKEALARELALRYPIDLAQPTGIARVLRTGVSDWQPETSDDALRSAARESEHVRTFAELGSKSYIVVPIVSRDRVLGTITLVSVEAQRRYSEVDLRVAEDLGRRVGMALENARLYREAQDAVDVRERVLAVVSHDLRNQLGVVTAAARLLAQRMADSHVEPPEVSRTIDRILRTTRSMQQLLGDLLDIASIRAGRVSFEPRACPLKTMLIEACDSHESLARDKVVTLKSRFKDADIDVFCDRDRVLQALSNLLGNAIKFCKAGDAVLLSADVRPSEAVVSVSDTGPGIPPDALETIFDAYGTAGVSGAVGTGLGLYITKRIVERHGGRIWVDSKVGVGSTFFFTLPRTEPAAETVERT